MTDRARETLNLFGVPEDVQPAVIAASDQLDAARARGADVSELDRLAIELGRLVAPYVNFGDWDV